MSGQGLILVVLVLIALNFLSLAIEFLISSDQCKSLEAPMVKELTFNKAVKAVGNIIIAVGSGIISSVLST